MILNTGNRTDIPAFFSDWFFNRIQEGLSVFVIPISLIKSQNIF